MTITRVFFVGDIDIYQEEFNWLAFAAYTAKREVRGFYTILIYTCTFQAVEPKWPRTTMPLWKLNAAQIKEKFFFSSKFINSTANHPTTFLMWEDEDGVPVVEVTYQMLRNPNRSTHGTNQKTFHEII